ncbi:diacylglycerol/lipid kinase family protein [Carboxylicivirga sp. RSCT41]|uniref:diacylglycerol/lipid kinase family protein n=1 Tax=Carboxylicivirga agarovorans TaxID=3417570 RepID=UPI003D3457C6
MKLFFVVNPISGGVDKEPFLKEAQALCKKYGITYHIFKTTGRDDETALVKSIKDFNPDKVASVGGDGTTLFTAVTLKDLSFPIGIIPLGSANGMAEELFVNPDPIEALKDIIMSERIGDLDLICVNDKHYTMHIGDVGVNASIVEAYEKDPNRGMATYARYFIEELTKLTPFDIALTINGETFQHKGVMVAICNSRKYGTGVPLNVLSNPMDGLFEIVIIENIDAKSLISAGLAKFDERFYQSHNSHVYQAQELEINFKEARLLQLDGEVIGKFDNIHVQMLVGAVKYITNTNNSYLTI